MPLADLAKRDRPCWPDMSIINAGLCNSISNDWLQLAFLATVNPDAYRVLPAGLTLERFL